MATLYITEFRNMTIQNGVGVQVAEAGPITEQTVSIGGSSTQSSTFNAETRFVRLHTDAICSVLFGTNPTATAAKARMSADSTEYFGVPVGGSFKLAVITNT